MKTSKFGSILTEDFLRNNYLKNKISTVDISKNIGCSYQTVLTALKKYKIPIYPYGSFRKAIYSKNELFFSQPNQLNSFVAGFIAADGCIRERIYTRKSYELQIILNIKDIDYLRNIKELLKYTGPGPVPSKDNKCRLTINAANEYYHDLVNHFNITQNKTYTLEPSNKLSWDNKLAFLVGLIDGDGCIFINKRGYPILSITGSEGTCIWTKTIWDEILMNNSFTKLSRLYKYKKRNAYSVDVCCGRAKVILDVLKSIDVPKMERKWSKV
jgi:hypothetical protein